MSGKHAAKRPQNLKRASFVGIGDRVHVLGDRKRKGTILGWDLRNPATVIHYVLEKKR